MKSYFFLLSLAFIFNIVSGQGIQFKGQGVLIENRSSYQVFETRSPEFFNKLNIDFQLSFQDITPFGYILYIKDDHGTNAFSLIYTNKGDGMSQFRLNEEGRSNLMTFDVEQSRIKREGWIPIKLCLDAIANKIVLQIGTQIKSCTYKFIERSFKPHITFGLNERSVDMASYAIRDLKVHDQKERYEFKFRENSGDIVSDQFQNKIGLVKNADWLIKNSYHWKKILDHHVKSVTGITYLQPDLLYFIGMDSLKSYNFDNENFETYPYSNAFPLKTWSLGMVMAKDNEHLIAYEVRSNEYEPTVTELDINKRKWGSIHIGGLGKQMHQHNQIFDTNNQQLLLFGGFGNQHYFNEINRFSDKSKRWESIVFKGDIPAPRFYSSWTFLPNKNEILLFGGIGNLSGDQTVGRNYFYDLYKIDLSQQSIRKLWDIKWHDKNLVPSRNLVMLDDSSFYALCYPEYEPNSYAQLFKFSIKDGTHEKVGDSIPFRSDMITTNLNLFFNTVQQKFIASIQVFDDNDRSTISIFTLNNPALTQSEYQELHIHSHGDRTLNYICMVLLIVGTGGILGYFLIKKRKKSAPKVLDDYSPQSVAAEQESERIDIAGDQTTNSIYLFGNFTIYNSKGKEITYLFSQRLRNLLLVLLIYDSQLGVSSQRLSQLIWPDKDELSVKNLRGVSMNQLRKALSDILGFEIIFENSLFRLKYQDGFCCDFLQVDNAIVKGDELTAINIGHIVSLLSRGQFLKDFPDQLQQEVLVNWKVAIDRIWIPQFKDLIAQGNCITIMPIIKYFFQLYPLDEDLLKLYLNCLKSTKKNIAYQEVLATFKSNYKAKYQQEYMGSSDLS
ncbi:kelch repeat-containing protein [Sphingobacterium sp. SRCM116780]|uniref:kelch repeat-containing protein n=1 Tax=Sphingobacterium sp. SRCM116780 TaxID=2907623 RepID=UPI001F159EFD|nr:kelch repeat-containing protein [Sphingobacterium sp. SRCM116780]UIR55282.1 kelch repeat-containing protein [Sphingobacterium sp. SRCM116780]